MEIYKREGQSPFYYVTLSDPTSGKRVRLSTGEKDKRAAQRAAAKLAERYDAEHKLSLDGKKPVTVAEALALYVGNLRVSGKPSWADVERYGNKLIGKLASSGGRWSLSGDTWLHDVTPQHLEDLRQARVKEGNGPVTIGHEIKALRAATIYARGLKRYRLPEIDDWRIPAVKAKTRYLSWEEFERVYAALAPDAPIKQIGRGGKPLEYRLEDGPRRKQRQDAQDLLVTLTMCGGRWGEVARLTWDRVDLKAGYVKLWGNKTQQERLSALPEAFRAVLVRRFAERDPQQPLIFPGRHGAARAGSCRAILRAMQGCGLNRPDIVREHGRATVHSLRHTFASWLIQNGAGLEQVKNALGHSTLQMTMRYAHLANAEAASKMAAILDGVVSRSAAA